MGNDHLGSERGGHLNGALRRALDRSLLIREYLRDPRVATFKATSRYVVGKVCRRMDLRRDLVVVEYGPGTGPFTQILLERLTPGSRLVAIETNQGFVELLRKIPDRRLQVFHDSAENVRAVMARAEAGPADYVLSGIPFSHYTDDVRMKLLEATRDVLGERGVFIAYQCYPLLRRYIRKVFTSCTVTLEPFHFPPYFILQGGRNGLKRQ